MFANDESFHKRPVTFMEWGICETFKPLLKHLTPGKHCTFILVDEEQTERFRENASAAGHEIPKSPPSPDSLTSSRPERPERNARPEAKHKPGTNPAIPNKSGTGAFAILFATHGPPLTK